MFWSGNFIVGKFATLFEIPPLTLNVFRWILAWLILIPFTYKEIYNNLAERVAIDNDSIVKANKNEFMDRAEILLGDTPLYQIPEYAE